MNKAALKKNVGHHMKIRPMAKRFAGGPTGPQLPPVDDDWRVDGIDKDGIRFRNTATDHGTLLGFDHIREFTTDPVRGHGYGTLILKTQVHIGGYHLWAEPIGPGGPVPDGFENVRGWNRANDAAYLQVLFPSPAPAPVMQPATGNPRLLGLGLLALFVGVGIAVANA